MELFFEEMVADKKIIDMWQSALVITFSTIPISNFLSRTRGCGHSDQCGDIFYRYIHSHHNQSLHFVL